MDTKASTHTLNLSRRGVLRQALAVAAGGALVAAGTSQALAAPARVTQKAANYRGTPLGKSQCSGCLQWQAPNSCKVVEGVISPQGWCSLFAPKPHA